MKTINVDGIEYIENPVKRSCKLCIKNNMNQKFYLDILLIPGIHSFRNSLKIESFFSNFGYRLPNIYECVKVLKELKSNHFHKYYDLDICVDLDYFITSEFLELGEDGSKVYVAHRNYEVDYLDWHKSKCKLTYATAEKYRLMLIKEI